MHPQMKNRSNRPPALIVAAGSAPSAVVSQVQVNSSDPKTLIQQFHAAFDEFKAKNEQRWDNTQQIFNDLNARMTGGFMVNTSSVAPDPEYSKIFAGYIRGGTEEAEMKAENGRGRRQAIQAAMSVGTNGAGGFLAPVEWDRNVSKALVSKSPMRRLARVVETSVHAYSTLYSSSGFGSGWVGETALRPNTSTPDLSQLVFPSGEIYANPAITQSILDDVDFSIEQWIADETSDEFTQQEGVAFLSGNGTNKPRGFLTYVTGGASDDIHPAGNLTVVPSGDANTIPGFDILIDFVYGLPAPYRQNAAWLMSSLTAAKLSKLKDGEGNYIWRQSLVAGEPAQLLGYPVEIDEGMPSIAAGNLPIAFGNFYKGYIINDRHSMRVLRDPYTNKPYVNFYTTKRVGGGVDDPKAIRLLKIAAS